MAATANRVVPGLIEVWSTRRVPMIAAQIMEGWRVNYDDSDSGDSVAEASDADANDKFAGVAMETVDNSSSGLALGAGNAYITIATAGRVIVEADSTAASLAGMGVSLYTVDGDTVGVAATTTNDIYSGFVSEWENVADPLSRSNAVIMTFGRDNRD